MAERILRVTLRHVATAARCHYSTVSLALRDSPQLPRATRDRVQAIARKLGYVPDPMLVSLARYRNTKRPAPFRSTLAWVTNFPTREGWNYSQLFTDIYHGAEERAQNLGYKLEPFWLRERGMTPERATRILRARNVAGLIVAPQPAFGTSLAMDWERFSAVSIGYTLTTPSLHLVSGNQYRSMQLALQKLTERGYQRLGLAMLEANDERVEHGWLAGYLVAQHDLPARRRLPPLFLAGWSHAAFAAWMQRWKPDAIVTKNLDALASLRRLGYRVPDDVGVAVLTVSPDNGRHAGIDENPRAIGSVAADCVAGMIYRNERGMPLMPQRLLIDGSWVDGPTVRGMRRPVSNASNVSA